MNICLNNSPEVHVRLIILLIIILVCVFSEVATFFDYYCDRYPFIHHHNLLIWFLMRSALFWDITQGVSGSPVPTFRDHLWVPSPRVKKSWTWPLKMGPINCPQTRWDQQVVPKRRYRTTIQSCVVSQKSADIIYIAAEAWNHTMILHICRFLFIFSYSHWKIKYS
jgi:hypothetical protein